MKRFPLFLIAIAIILMTFSACAVNKYTVLGVDQEDYDDDDWDSAARFNDDIKESAQVPAAAVNNSGLPTPTPRSSNYATPTPRPTSTPTPKPTATPVPDHKNQTRSLLTGEWVNNSVAVQRPWAIMFNNLKIASPQSGVGEASILYEALAEGGITRLMGIFQGLNSDSACANRIGSCRSARHYFVSFANEYDAIFIHYGATTYAYKYMTKIGIDEIDGTKGVGVQAFYRDKEIPAPHNAFGTVYDFNRSISRGKFRTEYEEGYTDSHFTFNEEPQDNPRTKQSAKYVLLEYSSTTTPSFTYDKNTGLYTRHQFGTIHTDYNTGEPLTFTNIIVQIVNEFAKDDKGYQDMDLSNASGTGYYITRGEVEEISWVKNEAERTCIYYDSEGNQLVMNPGKTYISIFPDYRVKKITIQ